MQAVRPILAVSVLLCLGGAIAATAVLPRPRLVPKPSDRGGGVERRARKQPTVPEKCSEIPFVETAPAPELTPAEKKRGYMLFQRPIMEPVYPNTHPRTWERLACLTAFGTPGEFEPLTFSVYPVRPLQDFRVRVSALRGPDGAAIPAENLEVRLVTYWNVGYPRYTSMDTYRRTPELLERVTVHTSPAGECQRWWITVKVPESARPGPYRGTVTVWDDAFDQAVAIPVAFRVLGFTLKADPRKHYSAYYAVRNKYIFRGKSEDFIRRATANEYRAMRDFGLDMCPTMYTRVDWDSRRIYIKNEAELQRMLAAGLRGPLPLAGGNDIAVIYRKMTPNAGRAGPHWRLAKMPPPEFYARITELYRKFKAECEAKGWPEIISCPLDEVDASMREFGAKVFKAVHDAGVRTYITKDPTAADAAAYRDVVDVWCSQPFSVPYDRIVAQKRYEYWSYPNHNAGEIKDRRVMCKGGRMTYGFGLWRSGYTTLIPWHWAWTPAPPTQFDYLRGRRSGCGQRIDDDGAVIPAIYWECFREGRDDERYIYTLQQAVWEREGAPDPQCRRLVEQGRDLLQKMWQDINVQQKYLSEGMWPSEEFNARRLRLAMAVEQLLRFPAVREGDAPSVHVRDPRAASTHRDPMDFIRRAVAQGRIEEKDLGGDWSKWVNSAAEGRITITPAAGRDGKNGLRWRVKIDHQHDGEGGGKYPIGWPRLYRSFVKDELDMARYDYLLFMVRVDSDRDEVADDVTRVGFTVHSNRFFEVSRDLGDRQHVWLPVLFDIQSMIRSVGRGETQWRSIQRVQFFIAERWYADGTNLTFDLGAVKLLRVKAPMVRDIDVPGYIILPRSQLPVFLDLLGMRTVRPGDYRLDVKMTDADGTRRAELRRDLADGGRLFLDTGSLQPGPYILEAVVRSADGTVRGRASKRIEALPGPLWQ